MNSKVNESRKALVDQIIQAMETEGLAWKRGWSSLGRSITRCPERFIKAEIGCGWQWQHSLTDMKITAG